MTRSILGLLLVVLGLRVEAVTVTIQVIEAPTCIYSNGVLWANAGGGVGPYTYAWSNGATTAYNYDLPAGTYSVTVTDFLGDEAMAEMEVLAAPYAVETYLSAPGLGLCQADAWLGFQEGDLLGPEPYLVNGEQIWEQTFEESWGGISEYFIYTFIPAPYGSLHTFPFEDGNGCGGTITGWAGWPVEWPVITIDAIQGACLGTAAGSVTLSLTSEGNNQSLQGAIWPEPLGASPYFGCGIGPTTHTYTGLGVGDHTVTLFFTSSSYLPSSGCSTEITFTIPDLGAACGVVTGRAFMDYNLNCTRQANEPYVPGGILEIQPGPVYATTDAQGLYTVALSEGTYTLEQQSDVLDEHCTGGPIPFTITAGQTTTVDLPDTSLVPLDVQAMLSSGWARPGFQFNYGITVRNLTPAVSGATSLTFTFDPTIGFVSATPTPSNVSGNTITWDEGQLTAFQQRIYMVRFQVPPDIGLLGYELVATANVTTANTDGNLANNTATNLRTITGAYDPNDKLAYTSSGNTDVWQINEDEWIDYTIRFQNTGTDTAFNVVITDTLPSNLDPGSIIMGASSHTFTWELRDQGTLKFYFPNILLPDSNINEPRSHGFVGFRIRPRLPLLPGDQIENIANIYFDFNPPVITEPSVLVATTGTGVVAMDPSELRVYPNPATDQLTVESTKGAIAGLRVLATDGRLVLTQRTAGERFVLSLSTLPSGYYMLEAWMMDGSISRTRIIKH